METSVEYTTDPTMDQIEDGSNDHVYYAQIPNMLDDLLDPYEFRLYAHIKRVCGAYGGKCWQSTQTMADACKMSVGKISEVKKSLYKQGFITIKQVPRKNGGKPYHVVRIVDIWKRNIEWCSRSPDEQASSQDEQASSPGEIKKNPLKEKLLEEPSPDGDSLAAEFKTPAPRERHNVEAFKARHASTPLGLAQETEQARAAVEHPDFADPTHDGDPWAYKPLEGFKALAHRVELKKSELRNWPRKLQEWAQEWRATPDETFRAICAVPDSEHGWQTFKTPYDKGFLTAMDAMIDRLRNGQPINAQGKRNGGSTPRHNPRGDISPEAQAQLEAIA